MNENLLVSIIIPAHNCEKVISQTIEACLKQNYSGSKEIIVVDDGSADKSAQIILSYDEVKYVRQKNSGPASARNCGARIAQGKYLVFTDSDCVPELNWLEKILSPFRDKSIAAVAGSYSIANEQFVLARCIHREILFRHHNLMPDYVRSFGSFNVAIDRDVFFKAGGFSPKYKKASGEDNDLSYKILSLGHKIFFERGAKVKHYHTVNLWKYLSEQYCHGFWRVQMYLDHPCMSKGDDYTFWKDILEIPFAYLIIAGFCACFFYPEFYIYSLLLVISLFLFQCFFAFKFNLNSKEAYFWGGAMSLRVFARALGFLSGSFYMINKTLCNLFINKKKAK